MREALCSSPQKSQWEGLGAWLNVECLLGVRQTPGPSGRGHTEHAPDSGGWVLAQNKPMGGRWGRGSEVELVVSMRKIPGSILSTTKSQEKGLGAWLSVERLVSTCEALPLTSRLQKRHWDKLQNS
jgi:hypothetical protein